MTVSRFRVRIILVMLFVLAVWIRFNSAGEQLYPYYKGESATNYRHANLIAESGSLPPLDPKMSWPDGYPPSRVGPNGVEYLTGLSYRVVSLFSDLSLKEFSGLLSILVLSLCVFPFFSLARHLWYSRAAGILAAFFVAFSGPLIAVTLGREYLHAPYAILLISCHLALFVAYLGRPSMPVLIVSPLLALVLAAVWRTADLYLAFFAVLLLLCSGKDTRERRKLMVGHLVAMIVAGVILPHLKAERFLLGWPLLLVLTSTVYLFVKGSLPSKVPGWVWVAGGTIVLAVIARPVAGGGMGALSDVEYWLSRFRFLSGKPDDPLALSDTARFLWTQAHANPLLITLVAFFLPFLFLIRPVTVALRDIRKEYKVVVWPSVALAAVGVVLFLIDRTAVTAAALGLFTLAAASARGITRQFKPRIIPIAIACVIMVLQALVPQGKANPTHQIASAFKISPRQTDEFLWISVGNADLDLVKFLAKRTSVNDAMLTPPPVSSLLVSFAGRKTVLTPGVYTVDEMERTSRYMTAFYDSEDELYAVCDANDIRYVLYTIDLALDTSNYSPRFGAGLRHVHEKSLAYKMHFEPETLTHFNLVFQNDNYRLFRVTKSMEPVFLTDHPPVYEKTTLQRYGGDTKQFYEAIIDALLTYQLALDAQAQGNDPEAVRRFRYCLGIAPRYTTAWLGVGDSLFRMGDIEAADAAYGRALEASPDHPLALYNKALTMVRLGRPVEAQGLLDVLISSSRDRAMVQQARELKAAIERDMSSGEGPPE